MQNSKTCKIIHVTEWELLHCLQADEWERAKLLMAWLSSLGVAPAAHPAVAAALAADVGRLLSPLLAAAYPQGLQGRYALDPKVPQHGVLQCIMRMSCLALRLPTRSKLRLSAAAAAASAHVSPHAQQTAWPGDINILRSTGVAAVCLVMSL